MKFEDTPNIIIYDAFKKAERYLMLHDKIAFAFNSNNFITKIVKDFLQKVVKEIEQEGFTHNKEIDYICIKDLTQEEIHEIYHNHDLVIESRQGYEYGNIEETSCFTDNSKCYDKSNQRIADIYCPLWWFNKEDLKKYKEFYGVK